MKQVLINSIYDHNNSPIYPSKSGTIVDLEKITDVMGKTNSFDDKNVIIYCKDHTIVGEYIETL